MPLTVGTRLGPYEILAPLGAGGMGEVFRARDTKLGRDVALKILPEAFAQDAERLARFEREARTLATLNHPHIAQIHGLELGQVGRVGESAPFIVMELVEGEDLSERIARGAMPLDEALPIARQIAEALGAAHEQGIVHRDLKPANIKVRPDGTVKVLDFGLAKALDPASGIRQPAAGVTNSPTLMATGQFGTILGTAAYMSPEQARGQSVDKRADIWAFGCVLYEMVVGRRPFAGDDLTLTLAAIVKDHADLTAAPPQVRRLLARCLEKDPRKRLRDIGDAFDLIEDRPTSQVVPAAEPRRSAWLPWMLVAVATAVAGVLGAARWLEVPSSAPTTTRFLVPWPAESGKLDAGESRFFEVSPDGRYFAIVSQGALWVRSVDQIDAIRLDRTDGATYPFWSPDSSFIGFFADGQLKKIARTGGVVQRICDVAGPRGGAWGPDGTIVFADDGGAKGLSRVSDAGGSIAAATTIAKPRTSAAHRYPQFLPDGRRFLFLHLAGEKAVGGVYVGSLDGAQPVRILEGAEAAQFAPAPTGGRGHLLFVQGDTLMAQAFDPAAMRLSGSPFSIVDFISQGENTGISRFSAGRSGVLAHSAMGGMPSELDWFDRQGKPLGRLANASMIDTFALDDLNRRLVLAVSNASGRSIDLWLQSAPGASLSKLTFGPMPGWLYPVWSTAGTELVYSTVDNLGFSSYEIRRRSVVGANREDVLFRGDDLLYLWDWSRDGQFLVMNRADDLWQLPLEGQRTPVQLTSTPDLNEQYGQVSPNGKWLAYSVVAERKERVFVQPVQPTGAQWLISPEGGSMPRWRRDGRALFFRAPDGKLKSVAVTGAEPSRDAATFEHRDAETLAVTVPTARNIFRFTYQPSADGQRFLVAVPAETALVPTTVVLNWQAGLKEQAALRE